MLARLQVNGGGTRTRNAGGGSVWSFDGGAIVADENGQMIFDLALVRVSLIVGGMTKSEETRLANLRAKKSDKKYELTSMDTLFLKKLESKKKRESRVQKSN